MPACLQKVETHCFVQDSQHMVLDVQQSRVLSISPLERELLTLPEGTSRERLQILLGQRHTDTEISQAVERLEKRRFLLSEPGPDKTGPLALSSITRLQLSVAQECNLRCRYCIVEQGSFGGPPRRMRQQIARQAVDFLLRESGQTPRLMLGFSGGEPMLNWGVVTDAIRHSQKQAGTFGKKVDYFLKTNGTLLDDEAVAFIKEERIAVLLSLDGPPAIHDRLRPTTSGRNSHDRVIAGLTRLLSKCPEQVFIRGTLTRFSPGISQLLDYLKRLGARSVNLQRVLAGADEDFALNSETRDRIKEDYTQLARDFLAGGPAYDLSAAQFIAGYMTYLSSGQQRRLAERACGEYLVVSASGEIYPHPDLMGKERYRLGHVSTAVDPGKLAWWRSLVDVDNRPICRDCWARYLCGGGCLAAAIKVQGTPDQPIEAECDLIRHLIHLAIWVHLTMRKRHPGLFLNVFPDVDPNNGSSGPDVPDA